MPNISIKDVAVYAKVSKSTVSRVVSQKGYVSDSSRIAVMQAIEELGYSPNTLARSLVSNQSKTIGICVPFLNTPFFASMMEGIESEADRNDYDVFIYHTKDSIEQEKRAIEKLIARRVDGIIIIPVDTKGRQIKKAIGSTPCVYLIRQPSELQSINMVSVDDYMGSRNALEVLIHKGHRKIGMIRGVDVYSTMRDRWRACEDVCNQYGIDLDLRYVKTSELNFKSAHLAAKELLADYKEFSAIYSLHYWGCAGLIKEARDRGIQIPRDISLSSFEAFDDWNTIMPMSITSNRYPSVEMGQSAVKLLHQIIQSDSNISTSSVLLHPSFQEGKSVVEFKD
ncbi:MAG: LacI family DNA-binding transcriptional regulator [Lacrimispora sp.]|uniref:LacI family DNA-binding transcriptional regulator n=1 Tax=Lacrimispora sp. TaxID=2719234 RepID=UPI0039E55EEF